ncbi:hypothetical protein F2Q70_00006102 [Brassica cretica]|uniref:Transmembrane protein n=1 Tax=Brassica cretica TaxID=69181 RepID=A0A8S9IUA4_BRACR|nr:hypothetical protein F2Q70_00006102 [Brassica cretica]
MVHLQSSISVVEQSPIMANSSDHNKPRASRKSSSSSSSSSSSICCDGSPSAAIDVLILIAVVTSSGFLIFPYIRFIAVKSVEIFSDVSCIVKEEILRNPDPEGWGRLMRSLIFSWRRRIVLKVDRARVLLARRGCLSCLVITTVSWRRS